MSGTAPLRVAAYGFFGMGNIGNEGSLEAFVSSLRRTHPEAALSCFAAGADAVERDHGIPARQLMTYRPPSGRGPSVKVLKALSRVWDVPRMFTMMGDVDVLVVPGTGVLETTLMSAPWGGPYWLFLAALSCRLRRRKVALLSVGAEYATHPLTRRLYRWTVLLSDYCTFRDEESREAVRAMGVPGRRLGVVFPDLAFALPAPEDRAERPGHVVIGVMAYDGQDPARAAEVRRAYDERMAQLVGRLVDQGRSVTLVVGDVHDHEPAANIARLVRSGRPDLAPDRLDVSEARTLEEIMQEMAVAEVVVASRFHNLVCALKLAKPTVSVGYADKNAHLLAEFGLRGFSQAVDSFDLDRLAAQLEEVPEARDSMETVMKETLRRFEDELGDQSRLLSDTVLTRARTRGPRRRRDPAW